LEGLRVRAADVVNVVFLVATTVVFWLVLSALDAPLWEFVVAAALQVLSAVLIVRGWGGRGAEKERRP
jgi:membrane protein implicated in regulation of membrane protease activity